MSEEEEERGKKERRGEEGGEGGRRKMEKKRIDKRGVAKAASEEFLQMVSILTQKVIKRSHEINS